jgi:hypothetical protein
MEKKLSNAWVLVTPADSTQRHIKNSVHHSGVCKNKHNYPFSEICVVLAPTPSNRYLIAVRNEAKLNPLKPNVVLKHKLAPAGKKTQHFHTKTLLNAVKGNNHTKHVNILRGQN